MESDILVVTLAFCLIILFVWKFHGKTYEFQLICYLYTRDIYRYLILPFEVA
ncbi:hypothetical protein MtrunA17_Chr5g0400851 [Medicago truncatula]|uniref:Uncharacterized protein n=1 Tax=Medicago truncatula TaxID=3880 RepID=A0A396HMU5_MEDTR|nr:hypothetical protein MtrunA17_Chr5g0400851 [Medicago truncatula]